MVLKREADPSCGKESQARRWGSLSVWSTLSFLLFDTRLALLSFPPPGKSYTGILITLCFGAGALHINSWWLVTQFVSFYSECFFPGLSVSFFNTGEGVGIWPGLGIWPGMILGGQAGSLRGREVLWSGTLLLKWICLSPHPNFPRICWRARANCHLYNGSDMT